MAGEMGDEVVIRIEPGEPDPPEGGGRWPAHGSSRRLVRAPCGWARVAVVVTLAGLLAGALFAVFGDGDGDGDGGRPGRPNPDHDPDEIAAPLPPRLAWAQATLRLEDAGSFAYQGTVHASEPSPFRPGAWLAADVTVEGAVLFQPSISRDVAVDRRGRAAETVTSGPLAWSRTAPRAGALPDARWRAVSSPEPTPPGFFDGSRPTEAGVRMLIGALRTAGNHRMDPPDGSGRRILWGTISAGARRQRFDRRLEGAEMALTLDEAGVVQRIMLTAAPADDPPLAVDLAIDRLGEPGLVTPGQVGQPVRRTLPTDALAAAGVDGVELGRVPAGWSLVEAAVWPGGGEQRYGETCPGLRLAYSDVGPVADDQLSVSGLTLWVTAEACHAAGDVPPFDDPIRAGTFSGAAHEGPEMTTGSVSDGATRVDFDTSLSPADAATVLESLVPLGPEVGAS